jgi:protein SCO1/2
VSEKDFLGRHMLVFFGFTYCPDICPTELQVMTAALDMMGADGDRIQPVFITVDPERDTPEVMKSYVENFGPRLVGLTGSLEEITAVAKAYRVYFAKAAKTGTDDYLMDHSSIIYLMGPDGRFLKHFTYTTDAQKLAAALKEALTLSP